MQNVKKSDKSSLNSKEMHKKVVEVHIAAKRRGQSSFNAKLKDSEIEQYCILEEDAKATLEMAIDRFSLSFRSIKKVQKVARTIADLDASNTICKAHIMEALSFRRR